MNNFSEKAVLVCLGFLFFTSVFGFVITKRESRNNLRLLEKDQTLLRSPVSANTFKVQLQLGCVDQLSVHSHKTSNHVNSQMNKPEKVI